MNALFESVAWNSLAALALALLVLVAGRVWKRPELLHVLWLVVLVKLVTPGLIRFDTIQLPVAPVVPVQTVSAVSTVVEPAVAVPPVAPLSAGHASLAIWIAGSLVLLILVGLQCARFARILRTARPADRSLYERIEFLARRLGVAPPATRIVDARVPPLVWAGLGRGSLVLPADLLTRLEPEETDTLLAHELAHLKRRDPLIRWLELAVTTALWWNPLVWWVKRKLRRAEELACDRWVLDALPGAQRAYADGIVKTVEFLAGHPRPPALATGATGTRHIKERLTMILKPNTKRRLRHPLVPALLLALLALPIVPGFADRDDTDRDDTDVKRTHAEMIELEREALELERRLYAIQVQQMQLEKKLGEAHSKREAIELRKSIEQLRRDDQHEEAARLEAEIEQHRRDFAAERAFDAEMRERQQEMREIELQMRDARIESESARHAEDRATAEDYERAAAEYERALEEQVSAQERASRAYEEAMRARQIAEYEKQVQEMKQNMSAQHREDVAQELALVSEKVRQQLRELKLVLEHTDKADRQEIQHEIEVLSKKLQQIESRQEKGLVR